MWTESESITAGIDDFCIKFSIEGRLDQVWLIRASIGEILREAEVPEQDIFMLQLAVSEVVNNSIEHGYARKAEGRVDVSLHLTGSELRIEIEDDAPPLPVERLKQMAQEQKGSIEVDKNWPSRGHGLQIVLETINSLDVARVAGRNRVTLRKNVSQTAG